MRLIDADKIGLTDFEIVMCNGDYKKALTMLSDKITNQPTAYDIGKVVEELEELKMRYFLTIANTGDAMNDFAYEQVGNALDKSIEIVKQGGVSDDVCKWRKYLNHPYDWLVGCEYGLIASMQGDYCPYCGKKIKVVE